MQDFDLARDLSLFARVLRRAEGGKLVLAIFVTSKKLVPPAASEGFDEVHVVKGQ